MIVFVDEEGRIKDVGTTSDPSLTELEINDDDMNPFATWSKAKICCYMCTVQDGVVTMMTPYRPSSVLDYIDEIGHQSEAYEEEAIANEDKAQAFDILVGEVEA